MEYLGTYSEIIFHTTATLKLTASLLIAPVWAVVVSVAALEWRNAHRAIGTVDVTRATVST